jgi:hypothetical protein
MATQSVSTYEPNKQNVGNLLSMTNPSIIVPDWQRNYSWKREHVETFWNDLIHFMETMSLERPEYFLGSVVIVREQATEQLLLLDGQQRLATSAILISVIRDRIKTFNKNAADQLQKQHLVDHDYVKNETVHKIRLNVYDREYFRRLILVDRGDAYEPPTASMASHSLILDAKNFFEDSISTYLGAKGGEEAFTTMMKIAHCLLHRVTLISVTSTNEDSAAEVFETLNDRGIGLSTPDLLRNLIMRRAAAGDHEAIIKSWEPVVSFENDTEIKSFIRHFWVSRYGDVKTQSLYREIKSKILETNLPSLVLATQLKDAAQVYDKFLRADTGIERIDTVLGAISDFGSSARMLYPALLSIFSVLTPPISEDCAEKLLNTFVRHSVICGRENSKLENVVYRAAQILRNTASSEEFLAILNEASIDDGSVEDRFSSLSVSHNGTRRYLLEKLETKLRGTEELIVAGGKRVHVEHIYPQTPLDGTKWANHDAAINRLGNLTLLAARLNTAIKNGPFSNKKLHYEKSELVMTKQILEYETWDFAAVEARQVKLAELAVSVWPSLASDTKQA